MIYLKAYQAYQQKNYDQCLKLLQEIKQNDTRKLDLLAQVHFQKKEYQKAYDIYSSLIEKEPEHAEDRKENLSTLIVCAQLEQPNCLVVKSKDKIPSPEEIINQVEMIDLKDKYVLDTISGAEKRKQTKKNKKKKIRLPKQYDPEAGPDPERWLPMRDRKCNAHKLKKRRQRPNPKGKTRAK